MSKIKNLLFTNCGEKLIEETRETKNLRACPVGGKKQRTKNCLVVRMEMGRPSPGLGPGPHGLPFAGLTGTTSEVHISQQQQNNYPPFWKNKKAAQTN